MNYRILKTNHNVFSKENCSFELATGMAKGVLVSNILLAFTHSYVYKRTCKIRIYNISSQFILSLIRSKCLSLTQQ